MCGRIEKRVIEARNNKKKEVKLMEHIEKQEPTDIKEAKRALRRQIRSQAPAMSDELRRTKGRLLAEAVMSLPEFVRAHSIIAFWPLADEINAAILLTMAQRAGKKTYLPVMQGNSLVFREYTDYHCLRREPHYGICEPNETMKTLDRGHERRGHSYGDTRRCLQCRWRPTGSRPRVLRPRHRAVARSHSRGRMLPAPDDTERAPRRTRCTYASRLGILTRGELIALQGSNLSNTATHF